MSEPIIYKINQSVEIDDIIDLYRSSRINRRVDDRERMKSMYKNSDLVVTAWSGSELVGSARALTDFSHCCYLSDLAVRKEFQKQGIGRELIRITKEHIGPRCMLLLLAASTAMDYYPKIGMEKVENAFIIRRSE